jgi:hypothetical protein
VLAGNRWLWGEGVTRGAKPMTPNYEDTPTGPPKKPGMPVWGWVLIGCLGVPLLLVLILAAILFPAFTQARNKEQEKMRSSSCMANCREINLAILMYIQDHDEQFPPKEAKWMDLTKPYIKTKSFITDPNDPDIEPKFHCPSLPKEEYGYAINELVLGKNFIDIDDPKSTELIFESTVTVKNAISTPKSIAYRHTYRGKEGIVGYMDSRVKRKAPAEN